MPNNEVDQLLSKMNSIDAEFFGAYKQQLRKNRHMYDCTWEEMARISGAEGAFVYIPPTAARSIDDPADHILTTPQIKVPLRQTADDHMAEQQIAERKRKFLAAWWNRVEEDFNVMTDTVPILLNEGRLVWRIGINWDLVPDSPGDGASRRDKKRYKTAMESLGKHEFLWEIKLLDNETVYEDPSNHRNPKYVFISYEILVEDAKEMYPEARGEWSKAGDLSKVKYTEYWTAPRFDSTGSYEPGRCVRWLSDERIWDDENPYPFIPIIIEDNGFGTNHSTSTPKDKYRGMTEKLFSTFVAEARQMTSWENVDELIAFSPLLTRNMSPDRKIFLSPGITIPLAGDKNTPGAEDVEPMQWPDIPLGVVQLVAKTTQIANEFSKMNTISGQPVPGVETATEANQQISNASAKLVRPINALRRAIQRVNRIILMSIESVLEHSVTLYGTAGDGSGEVTLGPGDINGFYETDVELRTSDYDMVSQIKARFWGEMYRLIPFLSAWTAMERGDIADDPTVEMLRRASEDVFLSPEMTMIRTMTGASSFGELASLLQQQGLGERTNPRGGSEQGLVSQETLASPLQASTVNQSLDNRDATNPAAAIRAPRAS